MKDVEVGRADPNTDPSGYRTLMAFQLAELHYGEVGLAQQLLLRCGRCKKMCGRAKRIRWECCKRVNWTTSGHTKISRAVRELKVVMLAARN